MNFFTYFDSNYANKGWACHKTLRDQSSNSLLYVICLDDTVYTKALSLKNEGVVAIRLDEVESYYPKLLSVKPHRQAKEYYATMTPILPLFLFDKFGMDKVFYTDADIAFWGDPNEIDRVFGLHSLMVTDHGFEPPRNKIRFNVGILGYRNDKNCKEFLNWWTDRCMEWCEWRETPDGKCADQGYLNILHDEPNRFKNVLSCPHPGINMGPWNIGMHKITEKDGLPVVDGKFNLICYHYHEFKLTGKDSYYPTGWKHTDSDRKIVYEPYFKMIREK